MSSNNDPINFIETTKIFKYRNSKDFWQYIQSSLSNMYFFMGKTTEWEPDDFDPPTTDLSESAQKAIWDDMVFLVKVKGTDVVHGIRRIDWQVNEVYEPYDDKVDMEGKSFYVLTTENNIYLCIDNNHGVPSTEMPSHVSDVVIEESDGYKWKYMGGINESIMEKYRTNGFIPIVPNDTVSEVAQDGSIERLEIVTAGSGYPANRSIQNGNEIPIFIEGNGENVATAKANITVQQNGKILSDPVIFDGGSGYAFAPNITFPVAIRQKTQAGYIQSAYGVATTDLNGFITNVQIVVNGGGYEIGEVYIVQSSAEGYAETNSDGEIVATHVRLGKEGSGFYKAKCVIISADPSPTEAPEDLAEVTPILSPKGGHGYNQVLELLGHYILLSIDLNREEIYNSVDGKGFRQIGLIDSPIEYPDFYEDPLLSETSGTSGTETDEGTSSGGEEYLFVLDQGVAKHQIVLTEFNFEFEANEVVVGQSSGVRGLNTTKYESSTLWVTLDDSLYPEGDYAFEEGEQIVGLTSGATGIVSHTVPSYVKKYSGDIFFINNTKPIVRSKEQRVVITLTIKY